MQARTLTVETKTTKTTDGANFKITTFETQKHVICDICGCRATDSKNELMRSGWEMTAHHEFCPTCNH